MLAKEAGLALDTLKHPSKGAMYGILSWGVPTLLFFQNQESGCMKPTRHLSGEASTQAVLNSHQSKSAHRDIATHALLSAYLTVLIRDFSKRTTQKVVSVVIMIRSSDH